MTMTNHLMPPAEWQSLSDASRANIEAMQAGLEELSWMTDPHARGALGRFLTTEEIAREWKRTFEEMEHEIEQLETRLTQATEYIAVLSHNDGIPKQHMTDGGAARRVWLGLNRWPRVVKFFYNGKVEPFWDVPYRAEYRQWCTAMDEATK